MIPVVMPARAFVVLLPAVLALMIAVACGDDDLGDGDSTSTPVTTTPLGTGDASPPGPGDASPLGTPASLIAPPLEGPVRGRAPDERTDFREAPGWELPEADDLAKPDDDADLVLNPPSNPSCPEAWVEHNRVVEGFKLCYPEDWTLAGNGYVNSSNQDRWYSVGIFDFVGPTLEQQQRAHVSVYVISPFVLPFRYTIDCPEAFGITFAGEPAVVCPDFEADSPEARIVSYHVFREDLNYFVNIVGYFSYDAATGEYSDDIESDAFDQALTIAHTFQFQPVIGP